MNYTADFAAVFRSSDLLLQGLLASVKLAASALAIAVPFGLVLAVLRLSRVPVVSQIAVVYIDFFRTAASLVLVFWFFYAFPILIGVSWNAYSAAVLALGLQSSAYFAEVYRSGIQSISFRQWDGARSIGFSYAQCMRYVILPQAIRRMIPVFFTRVIELFKTTSLAAAIAYPELAYQASVVASKTYRPIETYTIIAGMYFAIIFTLSQAVRFIERRYAVVT
jgi:polar amino acid transport system permease protein